MRAFERDVGCCETLDGYFETRHGVAVMKSLESKYRRVLP